MKAHTNDFKNNIAMFGRQLDSKITYTNDDEIIELGAEDLNSITPHYQGDILKSVMRQLDIDSNVEIPVGTEINYQFGVKIDENYEYLNFGNYIVNKVERQEDYRSYKITCYDKMLYSMIDYEDMNITYPITIRNYINTICNYLNLTFKNTNDTFANYNRQIMNELYLDSEGNSLGYTFRDVLDELAQATASTICINEQDDQLEIRYITETNDIINEEYLRDTNVNFGKKYGPINSIVLSRSAETDNVYLQDDQSIAENGLCELKIVDNQIMNWNDRSDYLPDLLNKLDGLQYYLNDFSSPGIAYYNLCDRYTIQIDQNYYSCVMLNDELLVTQGLQENIYTEEPIITKTDYTKADKTDRKINQTYLIVDKQNQEIEGVVSRVDDQDEQIATIRLQYNELLSRISDIADITTSGESSYASVNLIDVNASQPIDIKIHPIVENISYLYPRANLYPSDTLYLKDRTLYFTNNNTNEIFSWELPTNLWWYDSTTYDELELSYGDGTNSIVTVTRKCQINADGTVSVLATPTTETYTYPNSLVLTDGDYTINLGGYTTSYLFVQLMAKNIYTTQFYTKAETNSLVDQTASSITLGVNQTLSNYSTTSQMNAAIQLKANEINSVVSTKVGNNEVISKINQSSEQISINANKVNLTGYVTMTNLSTSGQTIINGANITTGTISTNRLDSNVITTSNFSAQNINADKITAGTLSVDRIQTKSINNSKLEDSTITGGKIASNTITGTNIANATITNGKIADATITSAKISSLSASKITTGSLTSSNVKIGSWNINGTGIRSSDAELYPTYLGYKYSGAWTSVNWTGVGRAGTAYSDKKLKKKIKKLDKKYNDFFDNLKPVSFKWKNTKYKTDDKEHIGFIAQDIQEAEKNNNLDLDIVYKADNLLNLDKRELIALNTWQIQLLKKEIKELKEEIENLKKGR